MKPLTASQRQALRRVNAKGGAQVASDVKGAVSPYMARLLISRGWCRRSSGVLLITDAGRKALNMVVVLPPPREVYLHKDGMRLTTRLDCAARDEPAVMDPPRHDWRDHAETLRKASRSDADALRLSGLPHPEERLAELRRMALERGLDIAAELRYVNHGLKVLERKVRQENERAA